MTVIRFSVWIGIVAIFGPTAFGQYGLYGSPDLVDLPVVQNAPTANPGHVGLPAAQNAPMANPGYVARPMYPPATAQVPTAGWQQGQPSSTFVRRPLLQLTSPAVPTPQVSRPMLSRYAVPHRGMPQYAASPQPVPQYGYAVPQQAMPRYAPPGMVQPHPAVANYYTPDKPKPVEQPQQAIPVPPTPPGMSAADASPSDASAEAPALQVAPPTLDYLDYNPNWGYCGVSPQAGPSCEATYGEGFGCSPHGSAFAAAYQPCLWYGGAKALFLSRNSANRLWTSYETGNEPNQLMHSDMIGLKWRAGGEVTIGRRFGCGVSACDLGGYSYGMPCGGAASYGSPWSLQATYFTIEPFSGYHSVTNANGVSSVLTVGNVHFHGLAATDWFDHARRHELWRRNEIHNVEVSFVRSGLSCMDGSRFDCDVEFGVRYFRFWEHLTFGSLAGTGRVDHAYAQQAFLEDKVSNDLFGFQLGFDMGYHVLPSCRIFAAPKFGIYNNHIDHYFVARLSDGTVGTVASPPGETFPSQSNTNVLSFLTQIDVGLDWQLTQRLSAQMGYRVIVATGMALADHQIPHFVNDIPEYRNIKHNGDLFLHGAFAGVTFNY